MKKWRYRQFRESNLVMKLFRITAIVLLFLVGFSFVNNMYFTKLINREIQDAHKEELANVVRLTNERMESIKRIMYQYSNDSSIVSLAYTKSPDADTYANLTVIRRNLNSFKNARNDIRDIFISFKNSDVVLGTDGTMITDVFYKDLLGDSEGTIRTASEDPESLNKVILLPATYIYSTSSFKTITPTNLYIYALRNMTIFVATDKEAEDRALEAALPGKDTISVVMDKDYNVITGAYPEHLFLQKPTSLDDAIRVIKNSQTDKIYTFLGKSTDTFNYVIGHNGNVSAKKSQQVNVYTIALLAVFILFSFLLFLLMNSEVYRPMRNLLGKLNVSHMGNGTKTNEYEMLGQAISNLHAEIHTVGGYLKEQEKLIHESFLNKMALGLETDNALRERLYASGSQGHYLIITCIFEDLDGNKHHSVARKFERLLKERFMFTNINVFSKEFTYFVNASPTSDINSDILQLFKFLNDPDVYLIAGVSRIYDDVEHIRQAYEESRSVLHKQRVSKLDEHRTVGFPSDSEECDESSFDINIQEEKQLMNMVVNGDIPTITKLLAELMRRNQNKSIEQQRELHHHLLNLYFIIVNSQGIRPDEGLQPQTQEFVRNFRDLYNVGLMNRKVTELFSRLAQRYASDKKELLHVIIDFIEQNYNKALYLDRVAEEVKLSYTYVSQYIKKATGTTFVDFLRNVRIEKAKELLKEDNKSVNEVALSVGFESANTFIRTFKKSVGMTPGEYKRKNTDDTVL